jgi:hypothetical protein
MNPSWPSPCGPKPFGRRGLRATGRALRGGICFFGCGVAAVLFVVNKQERASQSLEVSLHAAVEIIPEPFV